MIEGVKRDETKIVTIDELNKILKKRPEDALYTKDSNIYRHPNGEVAILNGTHYFLA